MDKAPIRIYLVDDQALIRAGFRSLLAKIAEFQVVGESAEARKAIVEIGELKPDIVLLDISMPGMSGIDAAPQVRKAHPKVRIVMLTHHEGETFVEQALRAGADGYLSKDSDPAELELALRSVHQGRMFLSPRVAGTLLQRGRTAGPDNKVVQGRLESLTAREREIFQLLAVGRSNKEVASVLKISVGTTKKHRENLQRKLDCHSSAEMALLAIKEGLLES